jgi:hypothetical protein
MFEEQFRNQLIGELLQRTSNVSLANDNSQSINPCVPYAQRPE